jgi:hypothetical protein
VCDECPDPEPLSDKDVLLWNLGQPTASINRIEVKPHIAALLPAEIARTHHVFAVNLVDTVLVVAMANPSAKLVHMLQGITNYTIEPVQASTTCIAAACAQHYDS